MPQAGNTFTVDLTASQLGWGTHRNSTNRTPIAGEGYIAIPKTHATAFHIYNSNSTNTGLGYNEFIATSSDGFIKQEIILAQGCSEAGDPYAKNLAIKGDLKRLGAWFAACGATTANRVRVTFTSPTSLTLEII